MSGELWALVAIATVVTFVIKAAGPVALGGRQLPPWLNGIVTLLAPALLAALVATQALADGKDLGVGANTVGIGLAGVALWRGANILVAVLLAVAVTAGLRAL